MGTGYVHHGNNFDGKHENLTQRVQVQHINTKTDIRDIYNLIRLVANHLPLDSEANKYKPNHHIAVDIVIYWLCRPIYINIIQFA